ncbi:pyridoxamine 5'-phosphate oxidase family protein [Nocardioides plantarum]|uniref:Pyridoxamine 5'-phosphate oxidase family protein n=1 Tax=Nocardioides plantarum TaxID=29299 RepID=A0ABV5KAT8_9ACTN|nr:pyridoxamine 5'-phosphate oxidase family protein [Nocardioides plantarum]
MTIPRSSPCPWRGLSDGQTLDHLGVEECWRLLGSQSFGRLSFSVDDRVQVALTPYVARTSRVFLRAAAFGSVARRVVTRPVTLQIDDLSGDHHATWSVTATGTAHHVDDAATLAALWTPVRPAPWGVGQESLWIELLPDEVHGQRIRD